VQELRTQQSASILRLSSSVTSYLETSTHARHRNYNNEGQQGTTRKPIARALAKKRKKSTAYGVSLKDNYISIVAPRFCT
jgi:hypothetical protein